MCGWFERLHTMLIAVIMVRARTLHPNLKFNHRVQFYCLPYSINMSRHCLQIKKKTYSVSEK